jgi:hypothetical protein
MLAARLVDVLVGGPSMKRTVEKKRVTADTATWWRTGLATSVAGTLGRQKPTAHSLYWAYTDNYTEKYCR